MIQGVAGDRFPLGGHASAAIEAAIDMMGRLPSVSRAEFSGRIDVVLVGDPDVSDISVNSPDAKADPEPDLKAVAFVNVHRLMAVLAEAHPEVATWSGASAGRALLAATANACARIVGWGAGEAVEAEFKTEALAFAARAENRLGEGLLEAAGDDLRAYLDAAHGSGTVN